MADVRLTIAGREYIVTCRDGEEARLQSLGALVDKMAIEAGGPAGGLNESRTLLYSALLLADKVHDMPANTPAQRVPEDSKAIENAAAAIENIADRMEKLAAKLNV